MKTKKLLLALLPSYLLCFCNLGLTFYFFTLQTHSSLLLRGQLAADIHHCSFHSKAADNPRIQSYQQDHFSLVRVQ